MTPTISIRDLSRGIKAFEHYDFVRIEDKKTKENKGLIISSQYAKQVEEIISKLVRQKEQQKLDDIMQFAGSFEMEDRFKDLSYKEIRKKIAQEKYGE